MSASEERPSFTGLAIHRDLIHRYSFLYPDGWFRHEPDETAGRGAIYSPSATDVDTSFSVLSSELDLKVTKRDIRVLREGLQVGLDTLPECLVEELTTYSAGDVVGLEVRHSYRDGEMMRKRWIRLLYQGQLQVRLTAQGTTEAEFTRWLPMLAECMRTFKFGDWWSTVTGREWLPTLTRSEDD